MSEVIDKEKVQTPNQVGKITFTLVSGSDEIYQKVELPRLEYDPEGGREIFATWQPIFDESKEISDEFFTDANGLELISRQVFVDKTSENFSKSFLPVTSMIAVSDKKKERVFQVFNDRPQAGSVHNDGCLKLLIDRRVATNDNGGIEETMFLDFENQLDLSFRVRFDQYADITPAKAHRRRNILAGTSSANLQLTQPSANIRQHSESTRDLVSALEELGVMQISLTKLHNQSDLETKSAFL